METGFIISIIVISTTVVILRFLFKTGKQQKEESGIGKDHEYEIY